MGTFYILNTITGEKLTDSDVNNFGDILELFHTTFNIPDKSKVVVVDTVIEKDKILIYYDLGLENWKIIQEIGG